MFKTNKKKTATMNANQSGKNLPSVNIVSKGTSLNGTLTTQSDVRIAGTLEGKVESKSKVIISSSGEIKGNVDTAEADIAGKVDGEVRVSNKLILRKSALIEGDIYTQTLLVEEGAQINGACNMGDKDSLNAGSQPSSLKSAASRGAGQKEKQKIEAAG